MSRLIVLIPSTLVAVGVCIVAFGSDTPIQTLAPIKDVRLASILQNLEEITNTNNGPGPYAVRIFDAPEFLGECGGSIQSCPDEKLYITVADDGLGNQATQYEMPSAKGWKFDGWLKGTKALKNDELMGFKMETTIPDANIDAAEYKAWKPTIYEVWLSPRAAEFRVVDKSR